MMDSWILRSSTPCTRSERLRVQGAGQPGAGSAEDDHVDRHQHQHDARAEALLHDQRVLISCISGMKSATRMKPTKMAMTTRSTGSSSLNMASICLSTADS